MNIEKVFKVINKMYQEGIVENYAIGGAVAALRWTEPFFTQDLDVFIMLQPELKEKKVIILSSVYEYLKKMGYSAWEGHRIIIEGIPVDIFTGDELEQKAIKEAIETEYKGIKTRIMTPEYLIALFLRAGRDKDIRKIQMLMAQTKIDKTKLNRILTDNGLKKKFAGFLKEYEK